MTPSTDPPQLGSVLNVLSRERLLDLGRVTGAGLNAAERDKRQIVRVLVGVLSARRLPEVLRELGRDELKAVCRAHGLNGDDPQRAALIERVLLAAGFNPADSIAPPSLSYDGLPQAGQVLSARGRQWLVEAVNPGESGQSPLLRLACLDDDAPGKRLDLLWDLEIGARVIDPKNQGLDAQGRLDPPAHFGAYLHALKWSAASAADATRLQAPFRAGIKLMPHQLVPLIKALELPRANLFIADDVGLGKTIEAGLVLQELILRQQAEFVLVVCPASVCLQWRDEMMRRFGLRFEVMSRSFLALRRRERGFGVNPWATHHRFIVSTPLIRRPEYRDPLLAHLGQRAEKGLLILDEAHVAAPASASKYAVDSDTTRAIRDLAPKFDNRLFLSATPHNGHSNSFSALLEILDPIRFTRGSKVNDPARLEPVMVRRLKRDLRQLGVASFPERILCQLSLHHDPNNGGWSATQTRTSAEAQRQEAPQLLSDPLGGEPDELELAELLARYTELCAPEKGKGRLVFVNLQKRLLSSPEAFARSIEFHAAGLAKKGGVKARANGALGETLGANTKQEPKQEAKQAAKQFAFDALDPEAYGDDDDVTAAEELALVAEASAALPSPTEEATALLSKMRAIAERARRRPDAKVLSLFSWLQKHCCPALGRPDAAKAERAWTERRVILFTEYADTKRYLDELLQEAVRHTEGGGERLLRFHGGMGDEQRDEVQRAFNTPPKEHPVRILIATDAAREGVNLQAHCADLFHVDVPWNPSRLEQRNGRIDRTLQPASEVRCHYFFYTQRREDRVLDTLVRKIQTVQAELGSMGAVLMDEMERALEPGIQHDTQHKLENIGNDARGQTVAAELEALRQQETTERQQETTQQKQRDRLQAENLRAGQLLERSKRALQVDPDSLRGVVEIGLCLAGAESLIPGKPTEHGRATYTLPKLDTSWDVTLDSLRPPKSRVQSFWEWRATPPRPVTFEPLSSLSEEAEQLHLAHPLVKRILDRFAAQGFGAHDLCRVCAVTVPGENVARVIAYARLTLFGHGAARLHDELVAIAAAWIPGQAPTPYKDSTTAERAREATERALAAAGTPPTEHVQHQVKEHASTLFATLWPYLEAEADARSIEAKNGLSRRARKESEDLTKLLLRQQKAVDDDLGELKQTTLAQITDKLQRRQVELDIQHLETRATQFTQQLKQEPHKIAALYAVEMTRLSPVGLVVAWPES